MKEERKQYDETTKKIFAVCIDTIAGAGLLAGCGNAKRADSTSLFTGDPDALQIFIWGSSDHKEILVEQFPDIKFDFYEYNGLNITASMAQVLERDDWAIFTSTRCV